MGKITHYPGVGGLTTEPEVNLLIDKFGNPPEENKLIPYTEIEVVTNTYRASRNRWNSVTGAWRRKLGREHGVVVKAIPNEGFRVLPPGDRITFGANKITLGVKTIKRGRNVIATTDNSRLTAEERHTASRMLYRAHQIEMALAKEEEQLKYQKDLLALAKGEEMI